MNRAVVNFLGRPEPHEPEIPQQGTLRDKVMAALRGIYDPELPVNIVDLGLVYELSIKGQDVAITMTLTTPHCPVAESMPSQVESVLAQIDGIGKVSVHLTWDPPWNMDALSDEVKLSLGLL